MKFIVDLIWLHLRSVLPKDIRRSLNLALRETLSSVNLAFAQLGVVPALHMQLGKRLVENDFVCSMKDEHFMFP